MGHPSLRGGSIEFQLIRTGHPATRLPNLDVGQPPPSLASEAENAEGAGGEEWQGGRFRYATGFGSDGEGVVVRAFAGVGEVDQLVGAGVDGGGVEVAGGGDQGDQYGTGEVDVVEDKALAGVADAGEEDDIEGFAANSVDGSGGGEGRNGDEVEGDSEGELFREGEGVGVGVAGDGEEVDGVGVGGYGQSGGGED
jgi:hypothetical protein